MTLAELAKTLPNGFHDAELRALRMDFTQGCLILDLDVWVGEMADPARREAYRSAQVTLEKTICLVVEPPASSDLWLRSGSVRIDVGFDKPARAWCRPPEPPAGSFGAYLFVHETNSFLHVVAGGAVLEWKGEERSAEGAGLTE
jgi:hypothetical protein